MLKNIKMSKDFLIERIFVETAGRNKKPETVITELEKEANKICLQFSEFTDGVRLVQLILRSADGGIGNGTKVKKYISTNKVEFYDCVLECLMYKYLSNKNYRIYSTVNARDVSKAIRQFKQSQLDNDYNGDEIRNSFYNDVRNRWISALMKPSSKVTSYFIMDVDTNDAGAIRGRLDEINAEILTDYKTKNGWHIVTKPFNPELVSGIKDVTVAKDALILLKF